jgi:hypothetical protein
MIEEGLPGQTGQSSVLEVGRSADTSSVGAKSSQHFLRFVLGTRLTCLNSQQS